MTNLTVKTYRNGVPTVEQLRLEGYKVRVYHGRMYPHGLLCGLSKREYEVEMGKGAASAYVSTFGGFTRIELTHPITGETTVGKYNFGNRQFNRKVGLQAAIGRALAKLAGEK